MGVGAGPYIYVVVVQKFTFAISSPDEFLSKFFHITFSNTLSIKSQLKISGYLKRVSTFKQWRRRDVV